MWVVQESSPVRCEEHRDAMSVLWKQGVLQGTTHSCKTHEISMTTKASISFSFDSAADAKLIVATLFPEIQHAIPKTNITVSCIKNNVVLQVESQHVSALRAACNSYLRWIQTALNVRQLL